MKPKKGLYIQLYNIHGLIRGNNLELGRDADTGGQTKYVLDLATALSTHESVRRVEIVTRLIQEKDLDDIYAQREEKVNPKLTVIRIQCGGTRYIRKEQLWEHLEEFVDKSIKYIKSQKEEPDVIHSHYSDAAYVCTELTKFFSIPFVHTAHSLGRMKLENLQSSGMSEEEIERRYKMKLRIATEEEAIYFADRIVTSTAQEIRNQYGLYDNTNPAKFAVIPPGVNLVKFHPFNEMREWDEEAATIRNNIRDELWKFFTNMYKPIILALCRPDKRKNITGLIEAFGEDKELQKRANLAVFAGIRRDIKEMPDIEREVLTDILLLMDKYNLYGKMALPKRHDVEYEVPELYRIAAESRGVFVNSGLSETFGLTLIEAAASGLPVVATKYGGPVDIVHNLKHGLLIDVLDSKNISAAITQVLDNEDLWNEFSRNGVSYVHQFYSWEAHVQKYVDELNALLEAQTDEDRAPLIKSGKELLKHKKMIIVDIDDTLIGDGDALSELRALVEEHRDTIGFGVATGRTIEGARQVLEENNFIPDIIISSVGSEMYYRGKNDFVYAKGWGAHIDNGWKKDKIKKVLSELDFLKMQDEEAQRKFKISYDLTDDIEQPDEIIRKKLIEHKVKATVIISHGVYVDILPWRASKGRAVRYVSYRWNIPYENILLAGDSGNDIDMLIGDLLGVVVGNHTEELEQLRGRRRVYFAEAEYAAGILEGLHHYKFLEKDYTGE